LSTARILEQLHPGLKTLVSEKGWKDGLSEIQVEAFSVVFSGEDCIIEAPTAGGKTEAVLFPLLTRVSLNKKDSVQVLYLAPLKALLNNIETRAEEYAKVCGLHAFKWHGDVSQKEKIDEFNNPSQLLLTTPESLEAILLRKVGWTKFFLNLEVVIVDEAHNFASGDRGGHIISLLERLKRALKIEFQRIALTATIGNPHEMLEWLAGPGKKPGKRIYAKSKPSKEKDFLVHFFNKDLDNHKKNYSEKSHFQMVNAIYKILPNKKTIIFESSRKGTEAMAAAIQKMNQLSGVKIPVKIRTHHSSVSKYYREEAENLIQESSEAGLQAIISTSTLELGIDIGELDLVIQVGGLSSPAAFVQRVGRTGRRKDKKQFFRGFCIYREDLVLLTATISLGNKGISEFIRFPRKAFHLLAHQLFCLCLQSYGIKRERAWDILSQVHCFSGISLKKFLNLVDSMIQKKYLEDKDGVLVVGEEGEKAFLSSNWRRLFAVFDSAPMYEVMEGKKQVGTLDSAFVESVPIPFLFVLGGIEWEAQRIDYKNKQVMVKRTEIGDAPSWSVFRMSDVPIETAKEAGRILFTKDYPDFLDDEAKAGIDAARNECSGIAWENGKWVITGSNPGKAEIWTFCGDRINRTLAILIEQEGIGKAVSNYKRVEIKVKKNDRNMLLPKILELLENLKKLERGKTGNLEERLSGSLRLIGFSKFAKCLPDNLFFETMTEKSLDAEGLLKEIERMMVVCANDLKL
jgi:ATP-dependent Lhr-like helicase